MGTNVYGVFSQFWLPLGLLLGGLALGYAAAGAPRWRLPAARVRRFSASSEPDAADGHNPALSIDWKAAIDSLTVGVLIFNRKREVLACNKHYREMYDMTPEQVAPGTHVSALIQHRLEQGLIVTCDAMQYARQRMAGPVVAEDTLHEYRDGRSIAYSLRPMPDGGGIAMHEDVTEREALNRQFQEQHAIMEAQQEALWLRNAQFDAALNHMSQAMGFFDKEQRLIACNRQFAEMSGVSPEAVFPGITLWELIKLRHQAGALPSVSPEEYYASRCDIIAQNKPSDSIVELTNGRAWEIHQRPMPDGGWVTTVEDVTERHRLHAQLKSQYEIVKEQQEQLRQRTLQFDLAINNMSQGLCFFDGEQRLIVCNNRYAEMYKLDPKQVYPGITLKEIVDLRYAANSGAVMRKDDYNSWRDKIAGADDPSDSIVELQDGRILVIHHRPMADGGWVATHDDVTERQKLHQQLKDQYEVVTGQQEQLRLRNLQFDAAINNMTQGLCFFDKNQQLLVCNSRYVEMYDLPKDAVYPGVTLREIIDLRYAANSAPAMTSEEYYAWRNSVAVAREPSDSIIELANGRIFATHYRPMGDGGWVATHEDITEQQRLHTQIKDQYEVLKKQQEQLRLRNLQFDAAINNMTQGLCFFDKDQRLIVCNSRYIEMYDLEPQAVYPGVTLREVIELRYAANSGPVMTSAEYYAQRNSVATSDEPSDTIIELANGRIFVIHHRPMVGGGWVATHEDITEQRRTEDKIAYMAQHDILTGLANRALLTERMEQALTRAKRGEIIALHLVDLDHFKRVNDTLGHPVGDMLLQTVAERLRSVTRATDTLARLGGDEFAVLQVAMAESNDATLLAQRIIDVLGAPYQLDGNEAVIGATVGIALGGIDGFSPDQLVRKADMALYRAKAAGRGAFRLFEQEMDAEMQCRRALEQELREALPAGQFELRFQPMISTPDESISGFEAVIYWNHPREGSLPPDTFLPVAEEIGLAGALGEWALREACFAALSWPTQLRVAVNLSYIQFRNPGLPLVVLGALGASGLPADRLELEVPEAAMLNGGETTLPTLQRLRDLGVRVVMDDFGVPPSTISYLRDFQFHKIKIGRSLVNDIVRQEDSASIVRAVATLARGFGMVSVADGIQSADQRERAAEEGCSEMQGALFGRPLRAEDLTTFLSNRRLAKERSAPSAA